MQCLMSLNICRCSMNKTHHLSYSRTLYKARKALSDRQKDLELKTQQLEIKLSSKIEEDIKKARRKSTQAGQWHAEPFNCASQSRLTHPRRILVKYAVIRWYTNTRRNLEAKDEISRLNDMMYLHLK